jgi:hypothetical protein
MDVEDYFTPQALLELIENAVMTSPENVGQTIDAPGARTLEQALRIEEKSFIKQPTTLEKFLHKGKLGKISKDIFNSLLAKPSFNTLLPPFVMNMLADAAQEGDPLAQRLLFRSGRPSF